MKLKDCHISFQNKIEKIAKIANLPNEEVYSLWRKYSDYCQAGDQSAILFEFVQWNAEKLGGNEKELLEVV